MKRKVKVKIDGVEKVSTISTRNPIVLNPLMKKGSSHQKKRTRSSDKLELKKYEVKDGHI